MRRQRQEIQNRLHQLENQREADYELGCGFGSAQIEDAFSLEESILRKELAKTYNMTVSAYDDMIFEYAMKLPSGLPFR